MTVRAFRFGFTAGGTPDPAALIASARDAEAAGFATFGLADHFLRPFAPLIALQAVADATTTIQLTQAMLAQDFRHPAVLAKELATLDVFSGGRVQAGIGAGWMQAEYEQAGIRFDPAPVRIERLEEVVAILRGLFAEGEFSFSGRHFTVQGLTGLPRPVRPGGPPIMIGGSGPKMLTLAARRADVVHILASANPRGRAVLDPAQVTAEAFAVKLGVIEAAAAERETLPELGVQMLACTITDRAHAAYGDLLHRIRAMAREYATEVRLDEQALSESPFVAIGSVEAVCEKLQSLRERFGVSYFMPPVDNPPSAFAPVIERLTA